MTSVCTKNTEEESTLLALLIGIYIYIYIYGFNLLNIVLTDLIT